VGINYDEIEDRGQHIHQFLKVGSLPVGGELSWTGGVERKRKQTTKLLNNKIKFT